MRKILLAFVVMAVMPMAAHAYGGNNGGWNVGLAFLYQTQKQESAGTTVIDRSQMDYDIKIGYGMSSGLYLGVIYDVRSTGGSASYPARNGYGVVVGYHTNGWLFDFDYYMSSTHNVDATTNYSGGSNYQLDIGYDMPMSSTFYLGWQLTYKMLNYNQVTASGTSTAQDNKFTELAPMIRMGFNF